MCNFNGKVMTNFILKLLCMVGFIYQSFQLLNEYLMGKTVISLEVKRLEDEPLPAITICTRNWLSMRKLANSPQFHHIYENYTNTYQDYNQTYMDNVNQHKWDFRENITVLEQLENIYFDTKYILKCSGFLHGYIVSMSIAYSLYPFGL